jgi:hypothetical protein
MTEMRSNLHPELQTFGQTSRDSDHVNVIFKDAVRGPVKDEIDAQKELIYKSVRTEPLGTSMVRGHDLPAQAKSPDFAFGYKKHNNDPPAKELLFPDSTYSDEAHEQYVKSHGAYYPGEQKQLHYKWPGIDPKEFKFGKVDKEMLASGSGVRYCLNPKEDPDRTINRITVKTVEDKKLTSDKLGQCRNLGMGERTPPPNNIFGVNKAKKGDEWGAGDCITGSYTEEQQAPDRDLGCSSKKGWRNIATTTRAFGCPSVRKDVPVPELRSIADCQNYGDDPSAKGLLYPSRFQSRGVTDNDFIAARPKEEIRSIFAQIGNTLNDAEFERLYQRASSRSLTPFGSVSVEEFRQVLNESSF